MRHTSDMIIHSKNCTKKVYNTCCNSEILFTRVWFTYYNFDGEFKSRSFDIPSVNRTFFFTRMLNGTVLDIIFACCKPVID